MQARKVGGFQEQPVDILPSPPIQADWQTCRLPSIGPSGTVINQAWADSDG